VVDLTAALEASVAKSGRSQPRKRARKSA
jgi:hypothetical protein